MADFFPKLNKNLSDTLISGNHFCYDFYQAILNFC